MLNFFANETEKGGSVEVELVKKLKIDPKGPLRALATRRSFAAGHYESLTQNSPEVSGACLATPFATRDTAMPLWATTLFFFLHGGAGGAAMGNGRDRYDAL